MNISSVEDFESLIPLDLDDEGEGLPAYEESVSSGLSTFSGDDDQPHITQYDPSYEANILQIARQRLSEKEQIKLAYREKDKDKPAEKPRFASSGDLHDTSLPAYQPTLPGTLDPKSTSLDRKPSASIYSLELAPSLSLSRKYCDSVDAQITELTRTGLARVDFGSLYAQQSLSTITCALSLYGGSLVLFGTADGLQVVNVSEEVPVRVVWTGLPVWDIRVLRCIEEGEKTPRGSVAVLCGGQEDPARPGKPKAKGGEVEVRVWRFGSLASLARWSAGMPMGWRGLDMTPAAKKGKGKERSFFSPFSPGKKTSQSSSAPMLDLSSPAMQLANAWAADWIRLNSTTNNKPADVLEFALRQRGDRVYCAIATTSHILLHVGVVVPSGVSFRSTRKFYLPFAPAAMGLLDVLTPTGEPSLGIWISFGAGGMGMASVIRNSDSAVLDFKPPSGQGAGIKGGGGWSAMQNVWTNGREVYAFHRGGETIVYPAPLRLPISTPPIIHTTWPRAPLSSLVVPDGNDLLLITTSAAEEICTQRAHAVDEGYHLDLQDGTPIGEGRILPLAWGYIRDGVYVSIREMKEWRISAIEKV